MSETKQVELIEIHSWDEVPEFASETEEAEFWSTHCLGDEILAEMTPIPEDVLPPVEECRINHKVNKGEK